MLFISRHHQCHARHHHPSKGYCARKSCPTSYVRGNRYQCNSECKRYGNCGPDYESACVKSSHGGSDEESIGGYCARKNCPTTYVRGNRYQCNSECKSYGNCGPDYETACNHKKDVASEPESKRDFKSEGARASPGSGTSAGLSATGVRGTWWAAKTDSGGCSMPQTTYSILDAVAIGQIEALGALKTRGPSTKHHMIPNPICGQVYKINCGGPDVLAVVASTCNLGNDDCGVDMIGRTWAKATNNKPPGETSCSVTLTTTNAMPGGKKCFYRPDSGSPTQYYFSLGVFNTNGKLVQGLEIGGVHGKPNGSSMYWDFNGNINSNTINISYEDGSTSTFDKSECKQ
eukprot:Pgem_evm1s2731